MAPVDRKRRFVIIRTPGSSQPAVPPGKLPVSPTHPTWSTTRQKEDGDTTFIVVTAKLVFSKPFVCHNRCPWCTTEKIRSSRRRIWKSCELGAKTKSDCGEAHIPPSIMKARTKKKIILMTQGILFICEIDTFIISRRESFFRVHRTPTITSLETRMMYTV